MRGRARTIKSMLTEGSAAAIFAIRDWLEPSRRNVLLVGAEKSPSELATRGPPKLLLRQPSSPPLLSDGVGQPDFQVADGHLLVTAALLRIF